MIKLSQSYQGEEIITAEMPASNFHNLISGKLVMGSALFDATGSHTFNMLVATETVDEDGAPMSGTKEYQIAVSCDSQEEQDQFEKTLALIGCGAGYKEEVAT